MFGLCVQCYYVAKRVPKKLYATKEGNDKAAKEVLGDMGNTMFCSCTQRVFVHSKLAEEPP